MKAEHTAPPALADMARSFFMKCPQPALSGARSAVIAALSPSCASEVTILTPPRPRPASMRGEAVQKVLARKNRYPCEQLATAMAVDHDGDDHDNQDDATGHADRSGASPSTAFSTVRPPTGSGAI